MGVSAYGDDDLGDMDVEINVWNGDRPGQIVWQPYRRDLRFERLEPDRHYLLNYRRGHIETVGPVVKADQNGTIRIEQVEFITGFLEDFLADIAAHPVFVPATFEECGALCVAATDQGVCHHRFDNGVGFQSVSDAVLVKMSLP